MRPRARQGLPLLVRHGCADLVAVNSQGDKPVLLKRYGARFHSVDPNFDAHAMTEIGFRRSDGFSVPADEFEARYQRIDGHELRASAEGRVQTEAEAAVLAALAQQLDALRSALQNGQILVVESEQGRDYPKLREKVTTHVVEGENKLHFIRTVDPPLRIGIYAPRKT